MRLAWAYQALGKRSEAEESIARALRYPEMENDEGLVDLLIFFETHGKGLSWIDFKSPAEIKLELTHAAERGERMKSVEGLWRKRHEDHVKKLLSFFLPK